MGKLRQICEEILRNYIHTYTWANRVITDDDYVVTRAKNTNM